MPKFSEKVVVSQFLRELLLAKKKLPKRLLQAKALRDHPPLNMIDLGSSPQTPRRGSITLSPNILGLKREGLI